jgi:hypothetical protein
LLAQVAHPWLPALAAFGLPRAGKDGAVPLKLSEFVGSVERLAWARARASIESKHSTDINSTNRTRVCMITHLMLSYAGSSDLGSSACSQ